VIAYQVRARPRHQRCQLADEVHRIVLDRDGSIAPRSLEAIAHPAIDEQLESIARDRRACHIADQPLELRPVARRHAHVRVQRETIDVGASPLQARCQLDVPATTRAENSGMDAVSSKLTQRAVVSPPAGSNNVPEE
jgi:hypothetical protein